MENNHTSADCLTQQTAVQRVPRLELELCIKKRFLTPEQCRSCIDLIDQDCSPSTIADPNGDDYFRTSDTCNFTHDIPFVEEIDQQICAFAGIDRKFGEPLQGQRYSVGQEFKGHTDYFEPDGEDFVKYCTESGQRTWTFMIYLNEVPAGGATRFKHIDKTVQPETGKLICWNNMNSEQAPNTWTLHHGMKVRKGRKYVITKWFREKPWPWQNFAGPD